MELILKYFPELTDCQRQRFAALYDLYADWNAKINVVSRKDFDQLYLRHVLHSLAIAKVCAFDVVEGVTAGLGLRNLEPRCARAETLPERYDYVVSRAVTAMSEFVNWVWNRLERGQRGTLPNGILYLKGGDLAEELALTGKRWDVYDIARFFEEEFFETKKVVYTPKK